MPHYLDTLKRYGGMVGRGLLLEVAPGIAQGIICDFFHQWNVNVSKIIQDVQRNRPLWAEMTSDDHNQLRILARKLNNLDFITPELIINGIREDFPSVASLFLHWPEAKEWLERQVEDLKRQTSKPV